MSEGAALGREGEQMSTLWLLDTARTVRRAILLIAIVTVTAGMSLIAPRAASSSVPTTLYAVGFEAGGAGSGAAPSNLYTVDTSTGAATLPRPIMYGTTQLHGITGIDMGLDGVLYAVDNANARLLTIDPSTGEASVVGGFGAGARNVSDISFDAYGYLYGVATTSGSYSHPALLRIDPDGTLRPIVTALASDTGLGVATDSANDLYVKNFDHIYPTSPQTGEQGTGIALSTDTNNPADFSPGDVLYTVQRPRSWGSVGTGSTLETVDPSTGVVSDIGNDPDVEITGLAFDTGTGAAPGDSADLALDTYPNVSAVTKGDTVVFYLDVTNRGPQAAVVTVSDLLSTSWSYVSDTGEGSYTHSTGMWAVGTLNAGESAYLAITATALTVGNGLNVASLTSDVYNPGPTLSWSAVTVAAAAPGAPTITAVSAGDGHARVSWSAPSDDGGATVTSYHIFYCAPAPCTPLTLSWPVSSSSSPVNVPLLTNGVSYSFAVDALNSAGPGALSTTVAATPFAPTVTVDSATPSKGKINVAFQSPVVAPLEVALASPLSYQVAGDKGKWVACSALPTLSPTCSAKLAAKTIVMRVSDNGGATWGPASSPPVTVAK